MEVRELSSQLAATEGKRSKLSGQLESSLRRAESSEGERQRLQVQSGYLMYDLCACTYGYF